MKEEIKKSLNLLILLGFICQGFAWENWLMPPLFVIIWFLALLLKRKKQVIPNSIELLIFFLSLVLSLKFVGYNAYSRLLSMGNALMVLQAMRLSAPLDRRKKFVALIIAVTHLAVGSQYILDYSFIIILGCSLVLIPKVLYQLASEGFTEKNPPLFFGSKKIIYPVICIIMVLFFLVFPRRKLVSGKEAGMIISEGPMRPRMDTVTGGGTLSNKSILRIKGENIKYLKSFALDMFDGDLWTATSSSRVIARRFKIDNLENDEYRYVTVMDLTLIGSTLPVDKHVRYLKGNFFQGAHISAQDSVVISLIWPQANNHYEYWTSDKMVDKLSQKEIIKYTFLFKQPARLHEWLKGIVKNEKDPEKQVLQVEKYLKENFAYELGTPDLNRFSPVEDFIFNQKRGHCERFASALALLCRMLKIPSRVVIGYYVPEKNQFADYYNVQVSNGHAWVEAFIPNKGWVTFDATPFSMQTSQSQNPGFALTIKDWLDYFWYSKIVEFSSNDQNIMIAYVVVFIKRSVAFLIRNLTILIFVSIVAIVFFLLGKFRFKLKNKLQNKDEKQAVQLAAAEEFYATMLESLARKKSYRRINQTPYEFALEAVELNKTFQNEIRLITDSFCTVKYGETQLSVKQLDKTTEAVEKIKELCHRH